MSPPLTPPRWITADRLARLAIPLAGGVAAVPALARVDASMARSVALPLIVSTTLLCWVLSRWLLRAKTGLGATLGSVGAGALLGSVNAGVVLAATVLAREGNPLSALASLLMGSLFGGFIGAPLGALFGLCFVPVLLAAQRSRSAPTHDGLEGVLLATAWLLTVSGVFAGWRHGLPYRAAGFGLVVGGVVCAAMALLRDAGRLAWIDAVRRGRVARYALRPRTKEVTDAALLPLLRVDGEVIPDEVLVRSDGVLRDGPFRTMDHETPLALLHSAAVGARPVARRRMGLALVVVTLAAACASAQALSPWPRAESLTATHQWRW